MKILQPMREWWQRRTGEEETPFDGDTPAWAISLVVHLGALVILTALALGATEPEATLLFSMEDPEEEKLELPDEFAFSDEVTLEIGANSLAGEEAALAQAPIEADLNDVPTPEFEAEVGQVTVETTFEVATAQNVSNTVVRGSPTGSGVTGAMGAVDRITHEILLSLEQRKTLVVWVFDKSGSLQRQREAVVDRFERVYHELGVIEEAGNKAFTKHEDKPLLTSVVAFGEGMDWKLPKPTDNLEEIQAAVTSIDNDSSGLERVFSAVYESARKFLPFRVQNPKRNVMLIVFTDEAGDDQNGLGTTVDFCRKYQMPVYVVGVPAPFGRKEVSIRYKDPDPQFDQSDQWIPVHQGPESLMPERVKLHFSGSNNRDQAIDSGFGPYSLTRLCYETGGIYFAVHPNRNRGTREIRRRETAELSAHLAHFFDPNIMRSYRPDYVSIDEYKKLLQQNTARAALVQASMLSWTSSLGSPQLKFPRESEPALANLLSAAQQQAAKLEPRVQAIYDALAVGEKQRKMLTRPRWQAGYDLAMGRALAVMVRTKAYNGMLAKGKQGMKFKDEKNDTWVLEPSDEISVGSALEKQAEKARMYLARVVKEHEGTPWAMLAQQELDEPIGWKWTEDNTGVNAPRQGAGGGGGTPNPANDKRKMMKKPKPKRRPKL